jgi:hypothetical protein
MRASSTVPGGETLRGSAPGSATTKGPCERPSSPPPALGPPRLTNAGRSLEAPEEPALLAEAPEEAPLLPEAPPAGAAPPPRAAGGAPPRAGAGAAGPPPGNDPTTPAQLLEGLDWATRENARADSELRGHLDLTRVAVGGHSCGGLQALAISHDPRINTTLVLDSGIYIRPGGRSGVAIDKTGALLVADDVGNVIWRVARPATAR